MADFTPPARPPVAHTSPASAAIRATHSSLLRLRGARRAKALLVCVLVLAAGALLASVATARRHGQPLLATAASNARIAGRVPFGVGDQDPAIFKDPRFIWLGIRFARIIVPWDATRHYRDFVNAEQWLNAARAAGIEPLVAFNESTNHKHHLPALSSYEGAVRAFMHRFPWVNHYQPWNEENQLGQPTGRSPERAAQYFNWLSSACHKCVVTAADLLDGPRMAPWLRIFLKYAHHPQIWGLHPYIELHQGGTESLSILEHMVHGQIWLTEAGLPMWRYQSEIHRFSFTSMDEQVNAAKRLLALVRHDGRITRIYYYQWRAPIPLSRSESQYRHHRTVESTWDSGLLNPDCSIRPTFKVVAQALGRSTAHIPPAKVSPHGGWECLPIPPKHAAPPATGGSASG